VTARVTQLGYLGFEVSDLGAWRTFATDVLGLGIVDDSDGRMTLAMDGYRQRFFLQQGPADDLAVLGWEVDDEAALTAIAGRLESAGVRVTGGTASEAAARHVQALIKLVDPAGNPSELYWGAARAERPFRSDRVAGFVADQLGLGHCVITARSQRESHAFYTELLGFRLSDHIVCDLYGYAVNIAFFHTANGRHHTVAFGDGQKKRIHHFLLEAGAMDDVGLAYDRALRAGVRIVNTLGRHPNDHMFSFYACTPSGFQFEYGWGGRLVDDARWQPTTYDRVSDWGHQPPQMLAPRPGQR
jgi:2,3-dihydroxybiphenyl 1,2-dioxygenase